MVKPRAYLPQTREAAQILGGRVRLARLERRWTVEELAERVGVSHVTMRKVERGDLSVGLGVALEAAAILQIPLFHQDPVRRRLESERVSDRLALLPKTARPQSSPSYDF